MALPAEVVSMIIDMLCPVVPWERGAFVVFTRRWDIADVARMDLSVLV